MNQQQAGSNRDAPDIGHVVVLGAGAMGSLFGATLARGGLAVTLVDVRADHIDAVNAHGLKIRGLRRRAHGARARDGLHRRAVPRRHRARADQGDGYRRGGRKHTAGVRPGDGRHQLPEWARQRGGHRRHRRPRARARGADRAGRDTYRAGGGAQLRRPADVRGRDGGRLVRARRAHRESVHRRRPADARKRRHPPRHVEEAPRQRRTESHLGDHQPHASRDHVGAGAARGRAGGGRRGCRGRRGGRCRARRRRGALGTAEARRSVGRGDRACQVERLRRHPQPAPDRGRLDQRLDRASRREGTASRRRSIEPWSARSRGWRSTLPRPRLMAGCAATAPPSGSLA